MPDMYMNVRDYIIYIISRYTKIKRDETFPTRITSETIQNTNILPKRTLSSEDRNCPFNSNTLPPVSYFEMNCSVTEEPRR